MQSLQDFGIRWFEEVWNKGRRDAIAEMLAPNAVLHEGADTTHGVEGFYPFFDRLQAAFSEMQVNIQDTIVQDDKVCVRWSCTMQHTGDGLGMPATGLTLRTNGMSIMRVSAGKAIEGWQNWDMLGLLLQIQGGARPAIYIATA